MGGLVTRSPRHYMMKRSHIHISTGFSDGAIRMSDHAELYDAILTGNAKKAEEVTKAAIAANVDPSELVQKFMIPAMDEVGKRFECNEYFVPELLIAARAMKISLDLIAPLLAATGAQPVGRVVIGTVQGDLHDIGKNLVASMLEGGGFNVVDLGVDVPPERFVEAAKEKEGTIVALSALLTTTMTMMKNVIQALEKAGIRQQTKVMIGGAPITQQYADEIGADGYSDNASAAVALARKLA
jgi:5-methyltetrahydrofolate--homocysteine methyltransferase